MAEQSSGGGDHLKLLTRLRNWSGGTEEPNHLILVSFSTLGMSEEEDRELRKKTDESFERSRERRGAEVYRLTNTDTALLMKLNDYNQMEWTSELKVDLLRVIQQNFPEYFSQIDQSRMLRILGLQGRLQNAIKFLEAFDDRAKEAGVQGESRHLRESDIQVVRDGLRKMGKKTFTDNFIRSQVTVLISPGKAPMPVMREYFISVEMIRQHILTGVDFRGAGLVFQHLTRSLDQMLIDCFEEVNPDRAKASINLNVETVFTHSFQHLLEKRGDKALGNLVLEFRSENILQNWDQFQTASELIHSRGGTIAVDAIIPDSIGVIDLPKVGAKLAKVFWRPGAETVLPAKKQEIHDMQREGTVFVLARVDDELGIKTGHACGVTMFQGFHIDDVVK